ncbi:hypothetical protein [Umezawaea sp.]|uniref:hypothetical protein n=1 Tax=Umezawaea sp. TaxID=1955258 RepID=UPI002ED5F1A7
MSEFATTVRARVESAHESARAARAAGDEELAGLHEADLGNLLRLAREHGVDLDDEQAC